MSKKNKNNSLTKQGVRNLGFSPKSKVRHLPIDCIHENMREMDKGMYCPDCEMMIEDCN